MTASARHTQPETREESVTHDVTILAVGNPIMGDDGVGPALLDLLRDRLPDASTVALVDGGTEGLDLLPLVEDSRRLLLLDAIGSRTEPPGTVVRLDGDQVPRLLATKLSPHQVGLLDVLVAARLRGREPDALAIVGVVPESVELRVGLSDVVAAALADAVTVAAGVVAQWSAS